MTTWTAHHRLAEEAAETAEACRRAGDFAQARSHFHRAATHEEAAYRAVEPGKSRTSSIIGVSAVSLYFRAEAYETVERLSRELEANTHLHRFALVQLNEIRDRLAEDRRTPAVAERPSPVPPESGHSAAERPPSPKRRSM